MTGGFTAGLGALIWASSGESGGNAKSWNRSSISALIRLISKCGVKVEGDIFWCFFDLVGIFANWSFSQDLEQDCKAATCLWC